MKTEGINHYTVEHHRLGRGYAILTKHRLRKKDDLFMCCFQGLYLFYCRKTFLLGEEVWFADPKVKTKRRRASKTEELEEQLKSFFSNASSE